MTAKEFIALLETRGCESKQNSNGWEAQCPAHKDSRASLSVSEGNDGRILLNCFGGCTTEAVCARLGVKMADLFPSEKRNGIAPGSIVATYPYSDEAGRLLFEVVRYEPKTFRQRQPDPNKPSEWIWKMASVKRVLYRLPELLAAIADSRTIFVVEGEKDVENLIRLGLAATCNPGGAGKWEPQYTEALADSDVVILPDKDAPGRNHAALVSRELTGKVKSCRVVELPDRNGAKVKDASDWIAAGGTKDEFLKLVETAPPWTWTPPAETGRKTDGGPDHAHEFNLTDYGNAERLAFHHGNEIRYCPAWGKWLVWDGTRWAADDIGQIIRLAKDTVRQIYSEADAIQVSAGASKEEREALLKRHESIARHAHHSESGNALAAMVRLAESEEGLPVLPEHLDADAFAFNVQNGTLNLRVGTLKPHTRGDLITKLSPAMFDPAATCPQWEHFLIEIMGGDMDMATYLQRAAGYSLTADVREQCLFFPYGTGANGKSTFTGILELLAGDYFQKAPKSLIQLRSMGDEGIPTELADLKGARLVVCNEVEEGKRLAESQVKDLTGGDTVVARRMRQDFFRFAPTHKLWIYGNHRPVIRGNDFGIWRRIHLIPFDVCISPEKRDLLLRDKLRAELSGILNWAVEGCLAWQRLGLRPPPKVFAATTEYREAMDVIGQFLEDYCRLDARGWTFSARLYRAYADWAQKNGESALGQRNFGQRLRDRGFIPDRADGSRGWKGIELIIEPNAIDLPAYDYADN